MQGLSNHLLEGAILYLIPLQNESNIAGFANKICLLALFQVLRPNPRAPTHVGCIMWALQAWTQPGALGLFPLPESLVAQALPSQRRSPGGMGSPALLLAWGCRTGCPAPRPGPVYGSRCRGDDPAGER